MKNKLDICKATRKIAADSLFKRLQHVLSTDNPVSEVKFRDMWLSELRKNFEIFPDGWYMPPPHGIGVIFADEDHVERASFPTLRSEEYWPKDDIYLNRKNGILTFYCSSVEKTTGTIGDFGLTIYLGKRKQIHTHLKKVLSINKRIFNSLIINMSFAELYQKSEKILKVEQYANSGWISINDPAKINMGHTIPNLPKKWSKDEIAQKRIFFNAIENTKIKTNMAFTIEPRLKSKKNKNLPTAYFHTIVLIDKNGKKELLTNFDDIFKLVGMDYML